MSLTRTGTVGLLRGLNTGEFSDSRSLFPSISGSGLTESLPGSGLLSLSGVGSVKKTISKCVTRQNIHNKFSRIFLLALSTILLMVEIDNNNIYNNNTVFCTNIALLTMLKYTLHRFNNRKLKYKIHIVITH